MTCLARAAGPAPTASLAFDAGIRTKRGLTVVIVAAQEASMQPYAAAASLCLRPEGLSLKYLTDKDLLLSNYIPGSTPRRPMIALMLVSKN
jgi:hypothetical protein